MSTGMPSDAEALELESMTIPSLAIVCEILANAFIIWFLLIDFPMKCSRIAVETGGKQTCSIEMGGYIIATISAILILGGIYYLAKWNLSKSQ